MSNYNIDSFEKLLTRVDATESVIRQLISVLTPQQKTEFIEKSINTWSLAESKMSEENKEKLLATKTLAMKLSGITDH
ncbi:hypothetical protein [Yersinia rohdei]|uniref:hypothetical protein n=1 Tax=Yersinia rohdei TaxID=29485 RepID=UPI0025AAAEDD|nr:hypothetical protein [Yersinia rohdei]MDN0096541.1 hypothetical protein [Yersinia rohdei]